MEDRDGVCVVTQPGSRSEHEEFKLRKECLHYVNDVSNIAIRQPRRQRHSPVASSFGIHIATESTENTDPHHLFPRTRNCHERKGGDGRGTSVQGGVGFRGFRVFRGYHHTGGRSLSTPGLRPALARSRNVGYNLHRPRAVRRSRSGAEVPSGPREWGAHPIRHHQRQRPR